MNGPSLYKNDPANIYIELNFMFGFVRNKKMINQYYRNTTFLESKFANLFCFNKRKSSQRAMLPAEGAVV